ncbi:MAG: prephenate dehydrogenase/arogenate dehydrogenase family protein, partial [Deltaproteobacteria bacterium]|nr:prephenate dehydrogenase/arogenate dehydrogenase family protein [Deltaproteobacteria bacterium]
VDLLILATPVQSLAALAKSFLPKLPRNCLVSDVGSVKADVVRQLEKVVGRRAYFVGAHPIAGGE